MAIKLNSLTTIFSSVSSSLLFYTLFYFSFPHFQPRSSTSHFPPSHQSLLPYHPFSTYSPASSSPPFQPLLPLLLFTPFLSTSYFSSTLLLFTFSFYSFRLLILLFFNSSFQNTPTPSLLFHISSSSLSFPFQTPTPSFPLHSTLVGIKLKPHIDFDFDICVYADMKLMRHLLCLETKNSSLEKK